jgi:ABC-type glutathione transport system ATPase component
MIAAVTTSRRLNPFPGLRPFREDEAHLFFGREKQVTELLTRLAATRFLAVVGTSGSGKSSLVLAGLLPALDAGAMQSTAAWRIAVVRPGKNPVGELARKLASEDALGPGDRILGTLESSSRGLIEVTRQAGLSSDESLLVVVDQFEEIFRFSREEEHGADRAASFIDLLLTTANDAGTSIYVLLTMRSDFLGECAQFRGLPEALNQSQFLIPV